MHDVEVGAGEHTCNINVPRVPATADPCRKSVCRSGRRIENDSSFATAAKFPRNLAGEPRVMRDHDHKDAVFRRECLENDPAAHCKPIAGE
jgi:hypothetical protein